MIDKNKTNDLRATLLVALEDLWHLVQVLAEHESSLDIKSSYYSLFAHCYRLHRNILDCSGPYQSPTLIKDILRYLEGLVFPDSDLRARKAVDWGAATYPGLTAFHEIWISDNDIEEQEKLDWMRNNIQLTSKDQLEALESLLTTANQSFNDQSSTQIDFRVQLRPRQKPPDHVLQAAGSLFKVLDSKRRCSCNPSHQYTVQLCLETHRAIIDDCNFDLYLGLESNSWQEARIQSVASHSSSGSPRIMIGNMDGATQLASLGATRKQELKRKVERLCKDIIKIRKTLPDYGLRFRMEEDCLWKLQSERSSFNIDPSKAPVTLAQFIEKKSNLLNEKTKRVLSVLLSYAVYHLIGTPWLQSWSSSNITFFRSATGLPLRPYIETHLDENMIQNIEGPSLDSEEDDFDPDDALKPPYPCLVDLAVVLLELHKAVLFDNLAGLCGISTPDDSDMVMARYIVSREVFRYCASEMTDQTRMAVQACLDPKTGLDEHGNRLDEYAIRGVIYEHIVCPLEDELEKGFSDLDIDRLDTLVRNLDLANGGQPLPLDEKRRSWEQSSTVSRTKRRGSDDVEPPKTRVRFSHHIETHIQQDASRSTLRAAGDRFCPSDRVLNK